MGNSGVRREKGWSHKYCIYGYVERIISFLLWNTRIWKQRRDEVYDHTTMYMPGLTKSQNQEKGLVWLVLEHMKGMEVRNLGIMVTIGMRVDSFY